MANRYDRDPDDDAFGRREGRDTSRDDDHRQGPYAQGNRFGEQRQSPPRQEPWRDNRNERDRNDPDPRARFDQDYRQGEYRSGGSGRDPNHGRDHGYGGSYYGGREGASGEYYSSGRDYHSSYGNPRNERGSFGGSERDYGFNEAARRDERQGNYRGVYQEQVWTRDPRSGNLYGYEYTTRVDPRRFNAGDESQDRWRSNVNEQNRRFDIDRGWHTPGTSGYGNENNFRSGAQSQYGKGPKGYVRSDERIREDVCDRLSDDDEVDARDITVTVRNAEVILEGSVNDRRSKHRAEDVAESVSGVKDVTNHLRARKGLLQELGDKITGDDDAEHHGHRGSGTRNSTAGGAPVPQKTSH
jgi:osmotically-inducible protein OsmY